MRDLLRSAALAGLLLTAGLLGACGEPVVSLQDEDKGDISVSIKLEAACDALLGAVSGQLDPDAIQDLVQLADLPEGEREAALRNLGCSAKDGYLYVYNTDHLQLGICAGGYTVFSTSLQTMRLSIALKGATMDQYGYFLGLAVADNEPEARAKADRIAALLGPDSEIVPVVWKLYGVYYVLHHPCGLRYSDQLAADLTRMLTSRAALLTELWQATGAYDPETEMGTLSATLAIVPRMLIDLDDQICLVPGR